MVSQFVAPKKIVNSVFYPKWSKNHMINIENKTKNPITEHKVDIYIGMIKINKYK